MNPYYVIRRSSDNQFYFVLKAENHETILVSETYRQKTSAHTGIASCQVNSPSDARYRRRDPVGLLGERWHFTLIAANGEPIGSSETYSSRQARENGIVACKRCGPTTVVHDLSAVAD